MRSRWHSASMLRAHSLPLNVCTCLGLGTWSMAPGVTRSRRRLHLKKVLNQMGDVLLVKFHVRGWP